MDRDCVMRSPEPEETTFTIEKFGTRKPKEIVELTT
jgi:hypothetical protein